MHMRVLKEPLLHFLLAGAAMFGAYAWLNEAAKDPAASKAQQISIGEGDVRWLAENWTTQWRRPPTPDELRGLVTDYLNEQLLAREARDLGLEDNDVIVRRRLAQKLTFLIEDTLRRVEPSEDELERFYRANARRFGSDARISFAHIYFSSQRRADARSDAADALRLLLDIDADEPTGDLGDRILVEREFHEETEQSISGAFGPDFARAVFSLNSGAWSGPVESGYGWHLVRVSTRRDSQLHPLADVRARVAEEWRREQERAGKQRYLDELRGKYSIVADEAVKSLIAPEATARTANR
jgi:parvulin-like peptidyl-prolyl isomerase